MDKKEKIFYIDFIRVLSMFMIVTYHFYAHFAENNIVGTNTIFSNGKWGIIGVALFFMISGASLMYNYKEKLELKQYIKKRFVGIYPMFWIAYGALFIYLFYMNKGNVWGLPPQNMLASLFAMDGYLSPYIKTFYLIGEWFLGCIVLIYLVFPLLRKIVNKYPKTTFVIATILNLAVLLFYKNGTMPINKNFIVSIYSFLLGMYIINVKQFKIWQAGIGLIIAIIGYLLPAKDMNMLVLFTNISAYGLFITIAYVGQKIKNIIIQKIFTTIGKYSYAIFLVHHYLIQKVESNFQGQVYGIAGTVLLYITIWLEIIIFAKLLYMINKSLINFFKKDKEILSIRESKLEKE
ncbi:MAG: acyltransferase [Clostridia bacterium]|nr:acyltransferase [Clostridia bacterium]